MSRGVNKAIILGNACADPDVRYLPNGNAVTNISIATNESWKDKQTGQQQERTEFHRVVFFGRLAEVVGQYVRKGSKLYVEGKIQTRKWQDQSGQDRYSTEIVVDMQGQMQLLDGRPDGQQQGLQQAPQQRQQQPRNNAYADARNGSTQHQAPPPDYDQFDDDIPFAPIGLQEGRNFLHMI